MAWLKNLKLNSIFKFIFLTSSKLQYFIFYKEIETGISFLSKFLMELRLKIIRKRKWRKAVKKLNINNFN